MVTTYLRGAAAAPHGECPNPETRLAERME
jgi:hypothetical protein